MKNLKCAICRRPIEDLRSASNGEPLVHGMVCRYCNRRVIAARIELAREREVKND